LLLVSWEESQQLWLSARVVFPGCQEPQGLSQWREEVKEQNSLPDSIS
jgi:hypothetical protein